MNPLRRDLCGSVLALAALCATPAFAQGTAEPPVAFVQVSPATPRSYPGRAIDILGVIPSMSPEAVREILSREYGGSIEEARTNLSVRQNTVRVQSAEYLQSLIARRGNEDRLEVHFATPATGGDAVGAVRTLTFSDPLSAPTVETLQRQLIAKYGPLSHPAFISFQGTMENGTWMYGATAQARCRDDLCPTAYSVLTSSSLTSYRSAVAEGRHFLVGAASHRHRADPSRASIMTITFDDQAGKAATLAEALRQLQAAASDAYARRAVPQVAPRL